MNPFDLAVIADGAPFCDRQDQQEQLLEHAAAGSNVVLYGARRQGKTSLAKRVQHRFREEQGGVAIYAELFRVTSVENAVERIARGVYRGLANHKTLTEKGKEFLYSLRDFRPVMRPDPSATGGIAYSVERVTTISAHEQLRNTLQDLEQFALNHQIRISVVLDEFQDIVDLGDHEIEALMREQIQVQKHVSYIFAGSRRRVLVNMFADRGRPFYHSAYMMEIGPLPEEDLKDFIVEQFEAQGRACEHKAAEYIVELSQGAPYYAQAIAFQAFSLTEDVCDLAVVGKAFERVLGSERMGYEAILRGLTDAQVVVLEALAHEPTAQPTSKEFLGRTGLSINGTRKALDRLRDLDLVEHCGEEFKLVDPVLGRWVRNVR